MFLWILWNVGMQLVMCIYILLREVWLMYIVLKYEWNKELSYIYDFVQFFLYDIYSVTENPHLFTFLTLILSSFWYIQFCTRWEKDVVGMLDQKHGKRKVYVSFDCETLKAEGAAEDHIRKFMPKLAGMDAVGNSFSHILTPTSFFCSTWFIYV